MAGAVVCSMKDVRFAYGGESAGTFVLDHLVVHKGETVLLTGESGAGKSTLLGLVCGVLAASAGTIDVAGHAMARQNGAARDRIRANHIGYIFQRANLLSYLTPTDNVLLAGQFSQARAKAAGDSRDLRQTYARDILDRLGLGSIDRASSTLSVGQQQRVAAARALYGRPDLLVADEPTAALDHANRDTFFKLFLGEAKESDAGVLVVSHDREVIPLFDRHVDLSSIARWEAS